MSECDDEPRFHDLDFWLGDWDVFVGGQRVGTNRIEKILEGCAIIENWIDAEGHAGKSLFYYQSATQRWKQIWVTEQATRPGGLKEKELIERFDNGALRFQGTIPLPDGNTYLDRTTLTPLPNDRVQQVIEVSRDAGQTWRVTFDAVYIRAS